MQRIIKRFLLHNQREMMEGEIGSKDFHDLKQDLQMIRYEILYDLKKSKEDSFYQSALIQNGLTLIGDELIKSPANWENFVNFKMNATQMREIFENQTNSEKVRLFDPSVKLSSSSSTSLESENSAAHLAIQENNTKEDNNKKFYETVDRIMSKSQSSKSLHSDIGTMASAGSLSPVQEESLRSSTSSEKGGEQENSDKEGESHFV